MSDQELKDNNIKLFVENKRIKSISGKQARTIYELQQKLEVYKRRVERAEVLVSELSKMYLYKDELGQDNN